MMSNILKVGEIVDLGIEKEKARRDFYDRVSKTFQDKELKEFFSNLRNWEKTHIKKFTEIKNTLTEPQPVESYSGELTGYMHSLVDDKLYKNLIADDFSKKVTTPLDAIQYGIGFEKDSILFFSELLTIVHSSKKEPIQQLIEEEKQHIIYLVKLKQKFASS